MEFRSKIPCCGICSHALLKSFRYMTNTTTIKPVIEQSVGRQLHLPGEATSNRIRVEEWADSVSYTDSYQLLTGVYFILITSSCQLHNKQQWRLKAIHGRSKFRLVTYYDYSYLQYSQCHHHYSIMIIT